MFDQIVFLGIADFKTIKIPQPSGGGHAEAFLIPLGLGIGVIALVFLLLYFLYLLWSLLAAPDSTTALKKRRKGAPKTPKARTPARPAVLIDGSNVMHWNDNKPSLAALIAVIRNLDERGYAPSIVFDANAGWKLLGKYLSDQDFSRLLGLRVEQVLVVPKGTQADPFLLETAKDFGARIVTNDRFRDWAEKYPKVRENGFLIRGGMQNGKVQLTGIEAASITKIHAGAQS